MFLGVAQIAKEISADYIGTDVQERYWAAIRVFTKDRKCPEWTKYRPGLSPKEHLQRNEMLQIEEQRKAHDLKLAELDQRSQESLRAIMEAQREIAEATRQVATDHRSLFAKSDRHATWYQRAFLILALIALVLAFAPLAYPNGVGWLADHMPGSRIVPALSTPTPRSAP